MDWALVERYLLSSVLGVLMTGAAGSILGVALLALASKILRMLAPRLHGPFKRVVDEVVIGTQGLVKMSIPMRSSRVKFLARQAPEKVLYTHLLFASSVSALMGVVGIGGLMLSILGRLAALVDEAPSRPAQLALQMISTWMLIGGAMRAFDIGRIGIEVAAAAREHLGSGGKD